MPRNKAKRGKSKRRVVAKPFAKIHKMEKEFHATPEKLILQYNKEMNRHKRQEQKLKKALAKISSKISKFNSKIEGATGSKANVLKKQHQQFLSQKTNTDKDLMTNNETLNHLQEKHAKINALHKVITQFDKEWKTPHKNQTASAPIVKKERKIKKKSGSIDESTIETPDTNIDNVNLEEVTELAS